MSLTLNQHLWSHPKVVETKNAMVLMGNRYAKYSLSPTSMIGDSFNDMGVGDNMLNTKECMFLSTEYRQGFRHHNFGIQKDPYIEDRYYCIVNGHHSNVDSQFSYICVTHEKDNDITTIGTMAEENIDWYCIADIDETYIYAIGKHTEDTGSYIYKFDKFTYEFISNIFYADPTARSIAQLIYKDETHLWFIMRYNHSVWQLVQYNKQTDEVKEKTVNSGTLSYVNNNGSTSNYGPTNNTIFCQDNTVINEDIYEYDGKYYIYMPQRNGSPVQGTGSANQNIIAFVFDPSIAFEDKCFYPKILNVYNEYLKWNTFNGYAIFRFWIKDEYLFYAVYDESNEFANAYQVQGIHKFKITDDGNLEWISVNRISANKNIISMIFDTNKDRIIIGYLNSCEVMYYDPNTHEYTLANKALTDVISAGFDEYGRLWVMQTDGSVHVHNLGDPQEVMVKFERTYYAYDDSDIETYIEFSALSFSSEPAKGNYNLTLDGNARFKENSLKSLTIKYTDGVVQVPIVIFGDKQISCTVTFLGRNGD